MTDLNPKSDQNETPEDVATLYSWANLHGAKYRDFSAARAQTREKTRLRAEQAMEDEQQRAGREAKTAEAAESESAEATRAAGEAHAAAAARQAQLEAEQAARQAEWTSQQATEQAHQAAQWAAEHAAAQAAQHTAQRAAETASRMAAEQAAHRAAQEAAELAAQRAAERAQELAAQLAEQQAAEHAAQLAAQQAAEYAAHLAAQQAEQEAAQREAELAAQLAAEQAAQLAAHQAAEEAAQQAAELAAQLAAQQAARQAQEQAAEEAREQAAQLARERAAELARERAAEQAREQAAEQHAWPGPDRFPASEEAAPAAPFSSPQPNNIDYAAYDRTQPFRPAASQPQHAPVPEESSMPARNPWATPDMQEPVGRPAWLTADRQETPSQPVSQSVPAAPEDTLQGSRDRLTSRWFALRGIFDGTPPPVEAIPPPVISRAPAMAVFSLAGGVGKTSLVATLGRALSARGERVLLVDTAAFGLLPFFFGATDQRPGLLRTFSPPGASSDAPIQMVTLDPDGLSSETPNPEHLSTEIQKYSRGVSRVIVNLATASGSTTRRIMRMSPLVLVPVIPDMNSVVSVSSIDAFFERNSNPAGKLELPFYVLNQFDASLPLHLDVREVLREQLGDRLLPFALRRTQAMSEALAEGMTVMDYAPNSALAEDFSTLAGWVKSLSAPATTSYRGVRWSER